MYKIFLLIVQCDDADVDYEDICGYGGTGCIGNATNPICQSDTELQMIPSSDGQSCVPGRTLFDSAKDGLLLLRD